MNCERPRSSTFFNWTAYHTFKFKQRYSLSAAATTLTPMFPLQQPVALPCVQNIAVLLNVATPSWTWLWPHILDVSVLQMYLFVQNLRSRKAFYVNHWVSQVSFQLYHMHTVCRCQYPLILIVSLQSYKSLVLLLLHKAIFHDGNIGWSLQ